MAIVARFGKPIEDLRDSTLERMSYVQGPDSGYLFAFVREHGLVGGIRILPSGTGSECSARVRVEEDLIVAEVGNLRPLETQTPDSSGGSCGGFKQWDVLWRDASGNRILLSVDSAKHRLYVSYSSPLAPQ